MLFYYATKIQIILLKIMNFILKLYQIFIVFYEKELFFADSIEGVAQSDPFDGGRSFFIETVFLPKYSFQVFLTVLSGLARVSI